MLTSFRWNTSTIYFELFCKGDLSLFINLVLYSYQYGLMDICFILWVIIPFSFTCFCLLIHFFVWEYFLGLGVHFSKSSLLWHYGFFVSISLLSSTVRCCSSSHIFSAPRKSHVSMELCFLWKTVLETNWSTRCACYRWDVIVSRFSPADWTRSFVRV